MEKRLTVSAGGRPRTSGRAAGLDCCRPPAFAPELAPGTKVPLLNPFLKKKHAQRQLEARNLRALGLILTSLLRSDKLGDGVLLSRSCEGNRTGLFENDSDENPKSGSGVSTLMPSAGDLEQTRPPAAVQLAVQEPGGPFVTEASAMIATAAKLPFQIATHSAQEAVAAECFDRAGQSQVSSLYQSPLCPDRLNQTKSEKDLKTGLFQEKSEEASIDLVFDLLTQLQYHTHQDNGIEICEEFLQGICAYGNDCPKHHTVLPYQWQLKNIITQAWQPVPDEAQEHLERLYCNPEHDQVKLQYQTLGGTTSSIAKLPEGSIFPHNDFPAMTPPSKVYPETWISMELLEDFIQVPVSIEDKSYRTVYNLFHKTVPETKFRILNILRVQNPYLWEKYKRKKEYMSRKMSEMDKILNERHLFHGTSQDAVDAICKHNFDPRVCGKHATMFGQGTYFAKKASYSHNFSKKSQEGVHYMFLAKVLIGKYTLGKPTMRRPPPQTPADPSSDLYDSCVDNWLEPQIFVIFNDDQSFPYFIIQYEEVGSTVTV
ncbi:protein mono-ADP-ribosyltransferase TIPARP isoform X2 [Narcine bancroftii]|uniref:protein mono-ADP-ribosyltransferase TIPARP isoform X2 n=1 Tax=Narcine bancroftii TaxID=1343680 RepID=UPI0038319228